MALPSLLLLCALALPQDSSPPADLEGALRNDTFLPVAKEVVTKLAAGDATWERWRVSAVKNAELTAIRNEAFDAWQRALALSTAGDCVPGSLVDTNAELDDTWPDPDATLARRTESIESSVLRRLTLIDAADLSEWTQRFGPLAERELAAAGSADTRLANVERLYPYTAGAAEAAVRLFDIAFESGRSEVARGWLDRAAVHARGLERADARVQAAKLVAALALRRAASESTDNERAARATSETWASAEQLTKVATLTLPGSAPEPTPDRVRYDPRPGVAFLSDGTLLVQSARLVYSIAPDGRLRSIDLEALGRGFDWSWHPVTGRRAADWPLLPASGGTRVVFVVGCADQNRGNALLCIDPGKGQSAPTLHWGFASTGWRDPAGREVALEECLGPGLWSFEPGPVIVGTEVLVQARQWIAEADGEVRVDEGRTRAWCIALDLATGAVRWKRFLATGSDARTDPSLLARLRTARGVVGCAQPLAVHGGQVFVGTELGVAVLLDVCDGRPLWSLRSQRKESRERGWTTARPPFAFSQDGADSLWHWAPADSRFLYRLRNGADIDGRGLFDGRPLPLGELVELVGGGPDEVLALARGGDRRTLTRLDLATGKREDACVLGREEIFTAAGLASATRVLFASSRALYLFDRGRGIYLLQRVPLENEVGSGGGSVFARGEFVYVVDPRSVTILRAE